jgi:hypothetical protein
MNRDSTVYFIYDDGAKNDPVLLRMYIRQFFDWYFAIPENDRIEIGPIGPGLNVEDLPQDEYAQVLDEEFRTRIPSDGLVRFQIIFYAGVRSKDLAGAMKLANSVMIHEDPSGPFVEEIASTVSSFLAKHRSVLSHEDRPVISFAMRQKSVIPLAEQIYDRVAQEIDFAHKVLNRSSFLSAYPWESI